MPRPESGADRFQCIRTEKQTSRWPERCSSVFLACHLGCTHVSLAVLTPGYPVFDPHFFSLRCSGKMTMRTANAIHRPCDGTDRLVKPFWNCDFFTGQ